ncbi:MAG TPA: SPFH domain-containing protein [Thermomonospora sp.]|nr:SPFH domain-containing protein [Thermomonospora sp.]
MGGFLEILLFMAVVGGGGYVAYAGVRRVPDGHVGLIVKKAGGPRRGDDDPRVSIHGAAGPQARTLRANTLTWLAPWLYEVRPVERTHVPNGTIGVVIAKAGARRPVGGMLADHVDCDDFTDGVRFLREGGQQGRQQQVLTGGSYDINTDLFEVITVLTPEAMAREGLTEADLREVVIPVGETGVVITHVGAPPDPDLDAVGRIVPGHAKFQLPWVFLAGDGQQGVQQETLDEGGRYAINPWFAHVVLIPSRVLILEWSRENKDKHNLDSSLDQVVLDVQGHTVRLDMKQTVQIPPHAAPRLIRRFGDPRGPAAHLAGRAPVRQFVEKELASIVAGYFRRISARYKIQEFITRYDEVSNELATEVRQALAPTGVVAVTTTLEEFTCDEPEINRLRRQIALQVEQVKIERERLKELEAQRVNEEVRAEIEMQRMRVEEARRHLEYVELKILLDRLGPEHVAMERILHEWSQVNVPQVIAGADGDLAHAMLQAMPFTQARDMLLNMAEAARGVQASEDRRGITEGDG